MLLKITATEALTQLDQFSAVIDARSESEFALDGLPGALNWPVLTDAERIVVGTEYAQVAPFTAKKRGAALVARNIAMHIEREVMPLAKDWKPLVYCWRGGTRSGSLALVLDQIGFRVHVLEGGYREYRRAVIAALEELPATLHFRVICGTTGSGKSRLLQVLRARGAQVLDLEALANHRGSVLGLVPGSVQPGQKKFESQVWDTLRGFDASRSVFVESESKKVGDLRVPLRLVERMRQSPCIRLELPLDARVRLLIDEYHFFVKDTVAFCGRLDALRHSRGHEVVNGWQEAARAGRTAEVVQDLLVSHYDPNYIQSMKRNFSGVSALHADLAWDGNVASLEAAAALAIAAG